MSAEKIGCGLCSKKRRVLNTSELKIGQHICEPGSNKLKYKEKQHNLKANYFHHAIIAAVRPKNDYQAELVLIHYADVSGFKKGAIKKKEEMRDLEYHEIYVVEYKYSKYPPVEVVRRAESQIKQGVGNNTEKAKNNAENDTEKIEQNAENDREKIEQNAENDTEKIEQNAENDTEKIEQNAENDTEKIEQNAENDTEKIEQNAESDTEKIEQNAENHTEKIEQNAENNTEKIEQNAENHTEKIEQNAENDTEKIEQNAENDTEKIEQNAENDTEKIEQNAENHTEKIEQNAENDTEKIEQNAENDTEKIEQNAENHTEKIEQNAENHTEKIEQNAESDTEEIEQNAKNDTEKIEQNAENNTEKKEQNAENDTEKIEQYPENDTKKIEQNAENDTEKVEQNAENDTEKIEQYSKNNTEKIEPNAENDTEKVEQNDKEKIEEDIRNDSKKTKEDVRNDSEKMKNADNENQSEDTCIESVFGNYNLFKSNCEHFATWCVLGKQDCFQLDQKRKIFLFPLRVSSGAAGPFSIMFMNILQLCTSIVSEEHKYILGLALICVGSFYLLYLLYSFLKLKRKQNSKCVCSYCYEEKRNILVTKLVWFIFSGILLYMVIQACIPLFPAWPVTILTHVIFIILNAYIQWFYRCLKSPFASKSIKVKELSEVKEGDVIIFQQYGFKHFGIATKVTPKPGNFKSGTISFVHYKACLTSRVIAEEEIKWPEKTVWRLDLKRMTVLRPQEIIQRVRSRLGETKWHWRSNRSDHVCYWAVNKQPHWEYYKAVKNDETESETESEQKKFSSLEVETVAVHLRNEIETGDVVKFKIHNGNIKKGDGIIIQILDSATRSVENKRNFQLSLVLQLGKSIERSLIDIDLNTDTVKVKKFHPVHCHTMEERKSRAISALHDQENHIGDGKFRLVEFCVLKENRTSIDMETITLERKMK